MLKAEATDMKLLPINFDFDLQRMQKMYLRFAE